MTDAVALITSLGKDGKNPREIAQELHARGVTDRRGRLITPEVVEGFLRFAEVLPPAPRPDMSRVSWGKSPSAATRPEEDYAAPDPHQKKQNRYVTPKHFSEARRAEITRLYQVENMKAGDIAKKLGLSQVHLNIFLGSLAGLSVPPGEITEYIDGEGRRIVKCPPGWARGAYPQRNVGGAY